MRVRRAEPQDAELLLGDADAFGAFYRRHERAVLRYFLARRATAEVAADLTAEAFVRALADRDRFDPARGEPRAWLFGIAGNVLGESLRRGRVTNEARQRLALEPLALDDDDLARVERLAAGPASEALGSLDEEQRAAVRGRVVDELSYAELADELGCSESVVRKRVSRGLARLRATMEESA